MVSVFCTKPLMLPYSHFVPQKIWYALADTESFCLSFSRCPLPPPDACIHTCMTSINIGKKAKIKRIFIVVAIKYPTSVSISKWWKFGKAVKT